MNVGIIGLGNFGQLASKVLAGAEGLDVLAYDSRDIAVRGGARKATLPEVAAADAVILCIPLSAYNDVLPKLQPLLKPETLVVDICSVKVEPEKKMKSYLAGHRNLLITHPMFGPQSAADGVAGLTLVVTNTVGERAETAVKFCEEILKLKVVHMTSEEHDREMANIHALTFFVARGLTNFGVREGAFDPPSYNWLLKLSHLDKEHTEDLFRTMEVGNPFAKPAREKFVKTLTAINEQLEEDTL